MPSLQSFSEDALDHVSQSIQSLTVEQMAEIAAAQQVEDFVPLRVFLDKTRVSEYAESSSEQDAEDDSESPRARKRSAQTYESAEDFDTELAPLTQSSNDEKEIVAFKACFESLCRLQNRSYTGSAPIVHIEFRRITSKPCLADFAADCFLAAKDALSPLLYRVLCACVDQDFANWNRLPEKLRRKIALRVGRELLSRGIVSPKAKILYWERRATLAQRTRWNRRQPCPL